MNQQIEKASYYLALEGVTRYGLSEAVRAILQGKLGHAFFPSPPELRMQCDKAMEPHKEYRDLTRRQERYMRDRRESIPVERKPHEVARVKAIYRSFLAGQEDEQAEVIETERAEIRARYGLTDEAIAGLPDLPIPSNFEKPSIRSRS